MQDSRDHILPSQWLTRNVESHTIQAQEPLQDGFAASVGVAITFPSHSVAVARTAIHERGLGGYIGGSNSDRVCYGWEVAEALAEHFIPGRWSRGRPIGPTGRGGRGRRFHKALEDLSKAGF